MTHLIKIEFKRFIQRWQFYAVLFLLVAAIVQGYASYISANSYFNGTENFNAYLAFINAHWSGQFSMLVWVLPLALALLAGDSIALDRKTGFLRFVLIRTTINRYIMSKIVAAAAMGVAVTLIVDVLSFAFSLFYFPTSLSSAFQSNFHPTYLYSLYQGSQFWYCVVLILISCLISMSIVLVTLLISTWVRHVYLVVAIPWVFSIVLTFVFVVLKINAYAPLILAGPFVSEYHGVNFNVQVPLIWLALSVLGAVGTYVSFRSRFRKEGDMI